MFKTRCHCCKPFTIWVKGKTISIDRNISKDKIQHVGSLRIRDGWLGKSPPLGKSFKRNSIIDHTLDGNTLIVQEARTRRWIFIGRHIFQFFPFGKIVAYFSPMLVNDKPQPWAIDDQGYVYLFGEGVVINGRDKFDSVETAIRFYSSNNPYPLFYNNRKILSRNQQNSQIKSFWIGKKKQKDWVWTPNAQKQYVEMRKKGHVLVKYRDKNYRMSLEFDDFSDICAAFASNRKIQPMITLDITSDLKTRHLDL